MISEPESTMTLVSCGSDSLNLALAITALEPKKEQPDGLDINRESLIRELEGEGVEDLEESAELDIQLLARAKRLRLLREIEFCIVRSCSKLVPNALLDEEEREYTESNEISSRGDKVVGGGVDSGTLLWRTLKNPRSPGLWRR